MIFLNFLSIFPENIFDADQPTVKTYEGLVQPIVAKTLEGYNGTVFAYGQTSSGKTFTMIGDNKMEGIIQLAVRDIFKQIKEDKARKFSVRIGYIEIYNDKLYDLFNNRKTGLNVFEVDGSVTINQKEFMVKSEEEVFKKFAIGNRSKRVVETSTNKRSSRSHTIFRITIESHEMKDKVKSRVSNLFLVDLAGSEKPDSSSLTFNEGLHINKSLLVLGKIIRELSKKKSNLKKVNFRECKLTRILSPALGGNSLTAVICTLSPTVLDETYRTICFAQNAKKGKTYPVFNSTPKPASALKSARFSSPGCPSPATVKHVRFETPEKPLSEKKIVRTSTPVKPSAVKNLRRPRVPTPTGSETDLSIPRKKAKQSDVRTTSSSRSSFISRQRVVQSVKYKFGDGKVVFEKKQEVTDDRESTYVVEENDENDETLKDKDEQIKILEGQLESMREQFHKHRLQFISKLECKDAAIETMEKLHDESLQAANDRIMLLQNNIECFEKELRDKHTELKEMESKFHSSREQTTELQKSFDKKFKDCHKQYEKLLLKKREDLINMERRVTETDKEMKAKKVADLKTYIELEQHYDAKVKKALAEFKAKTMEIQQSCDKKLEEQESFYKKIICEKEEEIKELQLLATMNDDSKPSSSSQESINLKIENFDQIVSKSIEDLSEQSEGRMVLIFNQFRNLIRDVKEFVTREETPEKEIKETISITPPSSDEQNSSAIRGGSCPYCSASFSRKTALERHIRSKHLSKGRVFECDECSEYFKTTISLNSHKTLAHRS